MNDQQLPPHSAPAEPRPGDFSARMTRRGAARPIAGGRRQRPFGRLAILAAAIAVPAMAAPERWGADSIIAHTQVAPMGFEIPGESFPGSAFYYLAEQPYARRPGHAGRPGELALPARQDVSIPARWVRRCASRAAQATACGHSSA